MARKRTGRVVSTPRYRARQALSYDGRRVEPGAECPDLPAASISWLHAEGHIERIDDNEQQEGEG